MSAHTQSSSEQQADPLLGQVVQGHYRILQRVAKGGMAWIYRAEHTTLRNDLAIKILFPQLLEEPELCERFLEEARIQFTLKHPNIVQVTDVISERGLVGIVLEWINGRDLRYWLKQHRQPFTPFQIREVMMPVVDAVGYAHEKGIVHRDLKPGNIIFHHEGKRITAKVADFGIAKMLDEVDSQTKTGTMMGTLQYMSPEQIRDSKYVDQRSDIYSLGVILFRMATARLPFREKNALALMRQHEMVKPPRPSDLVPPIPAELDAIILRCLEKRPEDRFQTCEELYHALQELPEASVHSKSSLFPSYLIGQPAQDDFGDPSQSNPHGVKVIGSGGPLPTASIAPTDDSYIGGPRGYQTPTPRPRPYPGTGTPLPHTRPPQTRPPHSGPSALADDLALDLEPIPTGQPTGAPHAKTRTAAQRALDRVDSVVPQPTPQEDKKPSSNMLPLVVLFLFLLGGGGAAVYFVGPFGKTPPKPIVDAGAVAKKPPKKRKDNILDKLDKAVDDALRALKMEKLVLASTKLKQAMRFRSKGSKRPAWHQTKYYPGLYRIAGRVARGQNKPYAALRYLTNYVNANMTGKSKIEIEKHKQKSALIQKKDLPKLRKTVKRVASQAELQLAKLEKDIKRNRLTSAYATYTLLRKTTTDNPEVYRKLARSLQAFFPILSVAIYKDILDNMLPTKELAKAIKQEKTDLETQLNNKEKTIQSDFAKAASFAKAKQYGKLRSWLRKSYQPNQSFSAYHKQMVGLLKQVVTQDLTRAQQLLRAYMRLFKRHTQKGLSQWAKASNIPLELPTYEGLQAMQKTIKQWQRFAYLLRRIRSSIAAQNIKGAHTLYKRLPTGWPAWIKEDKWGFYQHVIPGASIGATLSALKTAFKAYQKGDVAYTREQLGTSYATFRTQSESLKGSGVLKAFLKARALRQWQLHLSKRKQRISQAQALYQTARKASARKQWKACSDAYGKYIKQFPKSHRYRWLDRKLDNCNCNQNVDWVICKRKRK